MRDPHATAAPDLVNRTFTASAPGRLWVADATRIPCAEGTFWLTCTVPEIEAWAVSWDFA